MSRVRLSNWALALASVMLTVLILIAAEVAVRVAGIEPREWPAAERGLTFFRGMRVDPLLGVLPTPGWSGVWMSGFKVEIDAQGFRTTGYPPLPDASTRVAFLGDSCTFGWGLDTAETFLARLDARQRSGTAQFELINAAAPGMSAVSGLYMLRERVLPLRPNLVVLGFSANNAFRFSVTTDAERFRFFGLRELLFRSRLFHILAARVASMRGGTPNPRARKEVFATPLRQLRRVAAPDEFTDALSAMVTESRAAGAAVVFLLFPRASQITSSYQNEDAAKIFRTQPTPQRPGQKVSRDVNLLQFSCLDQSRLADPAQALHESVQYWEPVYPTDAALLATLRRGAEAYVAGHYRQAIAAFAEGVAQQPASPLARYDLGVAELSGGDRGAGWRALQEANRLSCNAFVQYAVALWKVGLDLDVPVIDLLLYFQAQGGGEALFRDPAHPSAAGAQIIADALWPVPLATAHAQKTASPPRSLQPTGTSVDKQRLLDNKQ